MVILNLMVQTFHPLVDKVVSQMSVPVGFIGFGDVALASESSQTFFVDLQRLVAS